MEHRKRNAKARLLECARFGAVGALNTATDFIVLNALLALGSGIHGGLYIACKSASFIAAVTQSYFLNKHWVFAAQAALVQDDLQQGGRFMAVSLAGFIMNIAGSSFVFSVLGSLHAFNPLTRANVGALFGTLFVLLWNYFGYKFFVFKPVNIKQS